MPAAADSPFASADHFLTIAHVEISLPAAIA